MKAQTVPHGNSSAYHHMCRWYQRVWVSKRFSAILLFNSFITRQRFSYPFSLHPILADVDYYWRLEPHVVFYCDIKYDPFAFMAVHNKLYGFQSFSQETILTIPTLWPETKYVTVGSVVDVVELINVAYSAGNT